MAGATFANVFGGSSEQVEVVYERLLGRRPGPVDLELQQGATLDALLGAVVDSPEYLARMSELVPAGSEHVNIWTPELAPFFPAAGTLSPDRAVEVGRDGFLLLNDGTNAPLRQFQGTFELPSDWAERWTEALELRTRVAEELGVELHWLVVPDKTAVHADLLVDPPSPGDRPVHRLLRELEIPLLYPVEALRRQPVSPFLRTDGHLSAAGTRLVAAELAAAVGAPAPPLPDALPAVEQAAEGDLGTAYWPRLIEITTFYGGWPARVVADNSAAIFDMGAHHGTRVVAENPEAPDPRTCVIFGDSFTFTGQLRDGRQMQGLFWWLAFVFRTVHFVWLPFGWDSAYVRATRPDVVVCEGAERFAVRPPQADTDTASLADPIRSDTPEFGAPAISAEEVVAVFEHLLLRSPSASDIALQRTAPSLGVLLDIVLASEEFPVRLKQRAVRAGTHPNVWTPELARFARAPGARSFDAKVEVAEAGVLVGVDAGEPLPPGWRQSWRRTWAERTKLGADVGAELVWLVVPDGRTPAGGRRPAELLCEDPALGLLYPSDRLHALPGGGFLRTDSRPSRHGHRELARAVLETVDGPALPTAEALGLRQAFVIGDLGAHFRPGLGEIVEEVAVWPCTADEAGDGCLVVRNGAAPDPRVCLVVGARPERGGHGVAWWLALAFAEVHVVADWDARRLHALRPDVVVIETPEARCADVPDPAALMRVVHELPLVSIVTPSLNQGGFIEKMLRSVAAQDYPLIEHIVVDAESRDDTARVVAGFGGTVEWICEPDSGQADAINKGVARSRGSIVGWLNADDHLVPGAVGRVVETLLARPEAGFVHGGVIVEDPEGAELGRWSPPPLLDYDMLRIEDHIAQPAAFYTRARWDEVGGLREDLQWTLDWDLFLRLAEHHPIVRVEGGPLAVACLHPDAKTVRGGLRRYLEILRVLRAHGMTSRGAASYGLELLDRWTVRALQATGRPVSNIDVLTGNGPLASLRVRLGERLWSSSVGADGWARGRVDILLSPGEGDVILEGGVPEWCPLDDQELTIEIDGAERLREHVGAGWFVLRVPIGGAGPVRLTVHADRTFVPAKSGGSPNDRRDLAWVFGSIRRVPHANASSPVAYSAA